jgi:hypothetical protein
MSINDIEKYLSQIGQTREESQYGRTLGIHSPKRTGKTLLGVALIIYYLETLDYIKGVISNVALNLEEIGRFNDYIPLKNIKNIKREEYKNYIIFTDEFRRLIDARMSGSFRNRFISNILADTGKFSQIHILTDQEASSIDKRIRKNADAVLVPQINFESGRCDVKVLKSYHHYFELDAYDIIDQYHAVEWSFPFRKYYGFYDTEQPIEEYLITFEPKDYLDMFVEWMKEKNYYNRKDVVISKGLLTLWKEQTGVEISGEQVSALLVYMQLECPELDVKGRKKIEKN